MSTPSSNQIDRSSSKENVVVNQWGQPSGRNEDQPNSFYNHVQQQRELGNQQQVQNDFGAAENAAVNDIIADVVDEDENNGVGGFVKPKANEKKEKKSKRAEEKKKAAREKEMRKANASEYIPGMEGSVRPMDDDPTDDLVDDQQEYYVSFANANSLNLSSSSEVFLKRKSR